MTGDIGSEIFSMIEVERMADLASYVQAGRRFQTLSNGDLAENWVTASLAFFDDPLNGDHLKIKADFEAEAELRNFELPQAEIAEKASNFIAKVGEGFKRLKADPEAWNEANEKLQERIDTAIAEREKAKKS